MPARGTSPNIGYSRLQPIGDLISISAIEAMSAIRLAVSIIEMSECTGSGTWNMVELTTNLILIKRLSLISVTMLTSFF